MHFLRKRANTQRNAAGASHESPRTPIVHISGHGASNTTKIPREDTLCETKKEHNGGGRGKKARNFGLSGGGSCPAEGPRRVGAPKGGGSQGWGPRRVGIAPSNPPPTRTAPPLPPHPTLKTEIWCWPKMVWPKMVKHDGRTSFCPEMVTPCDTIMSVANSVSICTFSQKVHFPTCIKILSYH